MQLGIFFTTRLFSFLIEFRLFFGVWPFVFSYCIGHISSFLLLFSSLASLGDRETLAKFSFLLLLVSALSLPYSSGVRASPWGFSLFGVAFCPQIDVFRLRYSCS